MALQIRRGLEADRVGFTPVQGELLYTTDDKKLYVGDGATVGGNAVGGGDLVTETTASQFVHNQHSNLTFTYDVGTGRIIGSIPNFHIKVAGDDSTVRTVNLGETIKFSGSGAASVTSDLEGNISINALTYNIEAVNAIGGASLRLQSALSIDDIDFIGSGGTTVVRSDANTIIISSSGGGGGGANNSFETIIVPGQSNVVADNGTDTLTLLPGTGMDILTNGVTDTITFDCNIKSFSRISVAGQPDIDADTGSDILTIVAGSNITLQTNASTDSITINSLGTTLDGLSDTLCPTPNEGDVLYYQSGLWVNNNLVTSGTTNNLAFYSAARQISSAVNLSYNSGTGTLSCPNINLESIVTSNANFTIYNTNASRRVLFGGEVGGTFYDCAIDTFDTQGYNPAANFSHRFFHNHNDAFINTPAFFRSRNTTLSPTSVQAGDALGGFSSYSHNGVNYVLSSAIAIVAESTPVLGGNVPTFLSFIVREANGNLNQALLINSNGNVTLSGNLNFSQAINNGTIKIENNVIQTVVSNADLEFRTSGSGAIHLDNISINQGVIDTLDSSSLVVTPAAIFSSDVTVQNNLVVSNKVYAEEFVSTSNVTPEISASTQLSIKVGSKQWDILDNGHLQFPSGALLLGDTVDALSITNSNLDNSVNVGTIGVIITTNATSLSRNFNFNTDGGLQLPILTAAPITPNRGFYIADGVSWDPASKSGVVSYPVFYDGIAFNALY